MSHIVTVTGATGHIGNALAERLLDAGVRVRAISRHADRLAPLTAKGAEGCVGDLEDTKFLSQALRGVDAAFAMIPAHVDVPDLGADQRLIAASFVEALQTTGVSHVVALSSVGADQSSGTGPIVGLHELEQRLLSIPGLAVVALRPTFFMENHLASIDLIKSAGINGSAVAADLPVAMIATRDIAAVAAEYLTAPTFEDFTVRELLGPRDYTHREATEILGAAIGKLGLAYEQFSYEEYHKALLGVGFSVSVADAYIEMSAALNEGRLHSAAGRDEGSATPTALEDFAREVFAPAYGTG